MYKLWKGVGRACLNSLKPYVWKCQRGTEPEVWVGSGHRRAEAPLAIAHHGETAFYSSHCSLSVFLSLFLQPKPTSQPLTRPGFRAGLVRANNPQRSHHFSWEDSKKRVGVGGKHVGLNMLRSGGSGSLAIRFWESSSQPSIDKDEETHMGLVCERDPTWLQFGREKNMSFHRRENKHGERLTTDRHTELSPDMWGERRLQEAIFTQTPGSIIY